MIVASRSEGFVGNDVFLMGRLVSADGTGTAVAGEGYALRIADVNSITCDVYDLDPAAGDSAVATPTVDKTVAILNTLTADALWGADETGRNFQHQIAGATFSQPHVYRIVYTLTLNAGEIQKWAHEHTAVNPVPG